jgi:hypothetical protein
MKIFIVLLLASMAAMGLQGQDTIVKVNGDEIQCKVMEVSPVIVKYKKFTLPDGPVYTINLSGIMMIKYQNGARDVFDNEPEIMLPPEPKVILGKEEPIMSDEELYKKGFIDANKYYSRYSGAGTATLLTSLLLNGLFGLIPAIPCSMTSPKMKNLGYPSQELIDNQSYYNGYMEGARKKKSKKVWMNWAIGTAISTVIIVWASSVQ